jgi:hypothetical protein
MAKQMSTLPVGSVVKSVNTKYNGAVVRFLVGHQASGRTKLVTERIISLKCFDAKEPSNPNSDRLNYGNNRFSQANIDQWLNSAAGAGAWYSARHTYDAPPNNANVWSNYNEYDAQAGFLSFFETDFRNAILDTTIRVAKNTVTDGGSYEDITRKVYLLSETEVGLGNENGIAEGSLWDYFNSASRRQAYPTAEAVSASEYTNSSLSSTQFWYWWLRTRTRQRARCAACQHGRQSGLRQRLGRHHWRSAGFELASSTLVSDTTDTDGAYVIQWNQPPTTPTSVSHGTPRAGQPLTITTGGSTDPRGTRSATSGNAASTPEPIPRSGSPRKSRFTDTVPTAGTNYQVRVKAVDSYGAESAYRTGNATAISYNTNPVISGSDQNMGAKTTPFSYAYTVTDAEAASQTLTVTET